mmetsp:Transcript_25866/g.58278  ORF Transcript_25866/g.58278 Transcript_25866/m.58278 type:complete len:227 (-) Transcript_25866:676-1356(-)
MQTSPPPLPPFLLLFHHHVVLIHLGELQLRDAMPQVRSPRYPPPPLLHAALHAPPAQVAQPHATHCLQLSTKCRLLVQLERLRLVLLHPLPLEQQRRQLALGVLIAQRCLMLQQPDLEPPARVFLLKPRLQLLLSCRVTQVLRLPQPSDCNHNILLHHRPVRVQLSEEQRSTGNRLSCFLEEVNGFSNTPPHAFSLQVVHPQPVLSLCMPVHRRCPVPVRCFRMEC